MFLTLQEATNLQLKNIFEDKDSWGIYAERKLLKVIFQAGTGSLGIAAPYEFVPIYAQKIATIKNKTNTIKFVDIGGGAGHLFPIIRAVLNKNNCDKSIEYHVLENKINCLNGRSLFSGLTNKNNNLEFSIYFPDDPLLPARANPPIRPTHQINFQFNPDDKIRFHSDIKTCSMPIDVTVSCIAIFYIEDLTNIISYINAARPKYIFFSYFLCSFDSSSITLAQPFEDSYYMKVTAHSIEGLKKKFSQIDYKIIEGSCKPNKYPDEIPIAIKQKHPSLCMADLYFQDVTTSS